MYQELVKRMSPTRCAMWLLRTSVNTSLHVGREWLWSRNSAHELVLRPIRRWVRHHWRILFWSEELSGHEYWYGQGRLCFTFRLSGTIHCQSSITVPLMGYRVSSRMQLYGSIREVALARRNHSQQCMLVSKLLLTLYIESTHHFSRFYRFELLIKRLNYFHPEDAIKNAHCRVQIVKSALFSSKSLTYWFEIASGSLYEGQSSTTPLDSMRLTRQSTMWIECLQILCFQTIWVKHTTFGPTLSTVGTFSTANKKMRLWWSSASIRSLQESPSHNVGTINACNHSC